MAHRVKCVYCSQTFDRDKIPFVPVGNRYAHESCHSKAEAAKPAEERDYQILAEYIKSLFNMPILSARITKQIKDFKEIYRYTYSGMLLTLKWWYEIKGSSIEEAHQGIGIIPFIYEDAKKYYETLLAIDRVIQSQDYDTYKPKVITYEIYPPKVWIAPPKLFNLDDDEEEV